MDLEEIKVTTKPYEGQTPGTSGLRKKVAVFKDKNYTENFIQAILLALGDRLEDSTLVVGGDGRYYGRETTNLIIKMCAANKVKKLIVGKGGILSTPAVSNLIRKYEATGGIILTASHNPGGPENDFGIKFNVSNGGPAPDNVTNKIAEISRSLSSYNIVPKLQCDIDTIGSKTFEIGVRKFSVDIIDPVEDYLLLVHDIFDFSAISNLLKGGEGKEPFQILINSMNGVTGPYVQRIFLKDLGANPSSVKNVIPLEDFGGLHPDPNCTYAADLIEDLKKGIHDFGAAFDGDGDRNMVLGKNGFFVTPSDSLAILADHLHHIPYFKKTGIKGYARSMPTAAAVDRVALLNKKDIYEVPTGWKYFGNLMDAGKLSLCGEESFGTGSDHIREKDGIWAVLAWLQIIACEKMGVKELIERYWHKYGRNFFTRYDYENCNLDQCNELVAELNKKIETKISIIGTKFPGINKEYILKEIDNFEYTDPVDGSFSKNQGIRLMFEDGSRIIYRLSGTGSSGATLRIYIDSYINDEKQLLSPAQDVLQPLVNVALNFAEVKKFTGRDHPTVIT